MRRLVRRTEAGQRNIEAVARQRPGHAESDAAPAAGDNSHGTRRCRHALSSFATIWSATRSACAATVSAGLTAADVGRKLGIDDKEVRVIEGAAINVERRLLGIGAHPHRAALVRRRALVEGLGEHDRIACSFEVRAHLRFEPGKRLHVRAPPLHDDALAVDHDAAFRVRQVLRHHVPVDRMTGHEIECEARRPEAGALALRMSPLILPSSWTLPSGRPSLPPVR